jgi:hypothetical protein
MKSMFSLFILFASLAHAETLRIGVVDSGLDISDSRFRNHICATGHKDFSGEGLEDTNGHGTEMVGLIEQYAGDGDYCLVIYKYYSEKNPPKVNMEHEVDALIEAAKDGVKIVNLSSSGPKFIEKEYLAIRNNPKTTFVVAAGNDRLNLDIPGDEIYPGSYFLKNEVVVGNVTNMRKETLDSIKEKGLQYDDEFRVPSSNYSKKIKVVEIGDNVRVDTVSGSGSVTGTSASCAIHTGKMIKEILNATK